jgi:capsular polysaccharide biosynthesis protein
VSGPDGGVPRDVPVVKLLRRVVGGRPGPLVRASTRADRQVQGRREVLESCDTLLAGAHPSQAVVLGGPGGWTTRLAVLLAEAHPGCRVLVLVSGDPSDAPPVPGPAAGRVRVRRCGSVRRAHAELLDVAAPDLFVDCGGSPASLRHRVFLHLFAALADGGSYLLLDGGEVAEEALQDRDGETLPQLLGRLLDLDPTRAGDVHRDDVERARMLGGRADAGPVVALRKAGRSLAKVREEEAERVLPRRLGPDRVAVLASRPATTFPTRARLVSNAPALDERFLSVFEVPARTLRVVTDVLCLPRQAAVADDLLLPASFHHPVKERLRNRGTVDAARWYARLAAEPRDVPVLEGTWYHLASEFPGHFGHAMTEDLARLWGLDQAREAYGDLRVLYGAGDGAVPHYWRELLGAYGVAEADIGAPATPVRVERLVTATPQLHNARYVDPDLGLTWDRVRAGLAGARAEGPRRIFVTRPPGSARRCLNGAEVEARFVDAGFTVVSPERLSMAEQMTLFAGADAVAGYAGSGLFSAIATAPGATMVVVASESYTAANEWLISSVRGFSHHQLWCPSTQERTERFDGRSFHADFAFDFERDGRALDAALESCAG